VTRAPETLVLSGPALADALADLAALRIAVFREWPYLYEGDLQYEHSYLEPFAKSPNAVLVGAFDQGKLVGAATGMPLLEHADDFASAFAQTDIDVSQVFYCAESVLLPRYRGQGIGHRFFDLREATARLQGHSQSAFCAVVRPSDHPARPAGYRPLDSFWRARGYQPLKNVVAHFGWKDIGDCVDTRKPLQFWARDLLARKD